MIPSPLRLSGHQPQQGKCAARRAQSKHARIRSRLMDVRKANLAKTDLIVDATGEQTVSHYLAASHTGTMKLNVWVEGAGVAVRALICRNTQRPAFSALPNSCDRANTHLQLRRCRKCMPAKAVRVSMCCSLPLVDAGSLPGFGDGNGLGCREGNPSFAYSSGRPRVH